MEKQEAWKLVRGIAVKNGLDPYLVLAIIEQESMYDEKARRLEQGFFRRYTKDLPYDEVAEVLLATSWGMMQTMGLSLYEMDFFHTLDAVTVANGLQKYLNDPTSQIEWGIRYFKRKLDRANGDISRALYYWNGSIGYPPQVLARLKRLKGEVK